MSPQLSMRRRSSSRQGEVGSGVPSGGLASLITTVLLGAILITGPAILGAARLWIELPLLDAVAFVMLLQGLRLVRNASDGASLRIDAIDAPVLLFALYAVLRWLTSPAEYFSRIEAMDVIAYAAIFLTCRYGLSRRTFGVALLILLVALGVGETAFGYYLNNHLDWFPFGPTERLQLHYAPRWLGTYGCPNHFAGLLIMATAAALSLGSFSKFPWPVRIVLYYLAAMMMVGVLYSGSRGGWIAFVAMIVALVIFGIRNGTVRWWIPVIGALFLLAAAGVGFSLSPTVQARVIELNNLIRGGKLDTYVRVELAEDALKIARDHPFFGTGPGTFVFVHPRYQSSTFAYKAVLTHDDYLNCLDDYGLVGFAIAMFFVAAVTLKFLQPMRGDNRWQDRVQVATAFGAWSGLLVHSLVDFNLHIPANAMMLFALTGLGLGRLKAEDRAPKAAAISLAPLGKNLGWIVVGLTLLYGFEVTRTAVGDITYENAFASTLEVPTSDSIQGAEEALKYDSGNAQDLVFLGDLYRFQASRRQDIGGRISEGQLALSAYERALRANLLDDTVEARMGMTYDVMRRYPEAFFCYKSAAMAQPYDGQFWYWLGNHYWERGMLEKAEQAYLMASQCPHGTDGSEEAEKQLRSLPQMTGIPMPAKGTNPLLSEPESDEPRLLP